MPVHEVRIGSAAGPGGGETAQERYYTASQWQLMARKFRRSRLAIAGAVVIALLYVVAAFCEFLAPYDAQSRQVDYSYARPQAVHWFDSRHGLYFRPFVYALKGDRNPVTRRKTYVEDREKVYPIRLFVQGVPYKMWGFLPGDVHLLGVDKPGTFFPFGTDELGRDVLSRVVYATRISMSVGLVGVAISFALGCILGGISGYYGGHVDLVIQRVIEFLLAIPTIPLWMGLAAAFPHDWSPIQVYFAITIILSLINWCYLARVVRGKLLELREEDFVMAALIAGAAQRHVIFRHLLPSFMSYLIVNLTLAIPYTILGETALSFLGLGIQAPAVSWGVLLRDAQNVETVALYPWLMAPVFAVIIAVLCLNFLGDGLRDAADPYR
jgi:peptide/nickel transport system permease protein